MPVVKDRNEAQQGRKFVSSDDLFKIGGTTIGTISIGGAIGNFFGPLGAVSGAVVGGIAGVVISTKDALSHRGRG